MRKSVLVVYYGLLPLVIAQLKDCFRYDQDSSNDIPCDPHANVGVSLRGSSSPGLLLRPISRSALVARVGGFARLICSVPMVKTHRRV